MISRNPITRNNWLLGLGATLVIGLAFVLVNCGGGNVDVMSNPPTGSIRVTISDPPTCKFPNNPEGDFKHVYVTIRSVQAHISSTATDSSSGWQELATGLATTPIQIDLLAPPPAGCFLATLGSNPSLPVGDYQQIRLLLVSNSAGGNDPQPASNQCGNQGFNCVVLSDDSIHQLDLSSQANTGLKIPPGQVLGGPIRVAEGSSIDLNIDFNACASIVSLPNNRFRLRPTLTAGQVGTQASAALSGQVVDSVTMQPIAGGNVIVAIEQADSTGVDRIIMEATADSNGNFTFCPVPTGMYDVVVVGTGQNNLGYNATVVLNVAQGTSLGKVPLVAETGMTPNPATIQGTLTASTGTAPNTTGVNVDAGLHALQTITIPGGMTTRDITIPLQGDSTKSVATAAGATCPAGTNCADYKLIVPASNPNVGTFAAAGTTFTPPAAGDVLFKVQARATVPMSGGTAICTPSVQTTDKDSADMPLKVTGGAMVTAKRLDFTGCM